MSAQPIHELSLELFAALQRGEAAAQRQFWQVFLPVIERLCTRILGDTFAAREVSAEVLCDFLFKYVQGVTCPQAVSTYLQLMAVRRAVKERGRAARPSQVDMDTLNDPVGLTPEDRAAYRVQLPRLEACLAKLSPKAQQVLKLRFFGDMTNEDIGRLVGGSKQYIGKLLTGVLATLKKCLARTNAPARPALQGGAP